MNQTFCFTILQHVSEFLHVSVAPLSAAVTVPLCRTTLSCSVCQEDTESHSVQMERRVVSKLLMFVSTVVL